jgi:Flp pilus assembly protein TadB
MEIFIVATTIVFSFGIIGIACALAKRYTRSKTRIRLHISNAAEGSSIECLYSQMESQQKKTRERLIWMHVPGHEHLR